MKIQILTAIATGTLLVNALMPVAFADSTITGNGTGSANDITSTSASTNTVEQSNTANVSNTVISSNTSGGNNASDNTGGDTTITTGNAGSATTIQNLLNANVASAPTCNSCISNSGNDTISGNGSHSQSNIVDSSGNSNSTFQNNVADVANSVTSNNKTGGNDASGNTGGNTTVSTGGAMSNTSITTTANANVATGGLGSGNGSSSNATATIIGNGTRSDNAIFITGGNTGLTEQSNLANISNTVLSNALTGGNRANDNTNGNVGISTGGAWSQTNIDNLANFNWADMGCGCDMTTNAKIVGNGSFSWNRIFDNSTNSSSVFQGGPGLGNNATLTNFVDPTNKTGWNNASGNTGQVFNDPVDVSTGNSGNSTQITNTANKNFAGSSASGLTIGGTGLNFTFDPSSLFSWL